VPALEEILYEPLNVLDHGFVRVIDYMGDDSAVVQAARVSYGRGTKKVSEDRGLIRYLMRHWHSTPFEMCEMKFHIKLPIFIARQWIRHRTANVNEYSARYSIMDKEFYIPKAEHLSPQSKKNHQGRSTDALSPAEAARVLEILKNDSLQCYDHYEELMNTDAAGNVLDESKSGIARELARMNLTMNYYTQWYWKIDLHNFLHFLKLRVDSHAQWEIQEYGRVMAGMLKRVAPLSYEAFIDYDVCGAKFSRMEFDALRRLVSVQGDGLAAKSGASVDAPGLEALGLSKREARELFDKLNATEVPDFELDLARARPAEEFAERFAQAVPKGDKPPSE